MRKITVDFLVLCVAMWINGEVIAVEPVVGKVGPDGVERTILLPPGPGNPRNSEGSFVTLRDGRILFVYSHFTGGGGDHSTAHLAGRYSSDGGKTWTANDVSILPNEGQMNVMSVSLLRLKSGAIALFYLRKNSTADCRPCVRFSTDEARTWSEPTQCIADEVGYYVMNNDRVIQTASGRLVAPVALHHRPDWKQPDWQGIVMCYLSDDEGKTWRRSKDQWKGADPQGKRVTLQEPGVVELNDRRVMMYCRTASGCQYVSYSTDGGEHWTAPVASNILAPNSPALIKPIPGRKALLLVWNNHTGIDAARKGKRTPFTVAVSTDDGKTWTNVKTLEDDPTGWYCYPALHFAGDHVIVSACAGSTKQYPHLSMTQMTRFPLAWVAP